MADVGGTILIVEDDAGLARLQQKRLERAGFSVIVAGAFEDAFEAVKRLRIDLVLLDYQLPGGRTGLDVQADFRSAGYDLPVVVVTGFHDEATVIKALRAGARDFVTKSATYLEYIVEVVERVLAQVRSERKLDESQALLGGVISSTIDAIICMDEQERVTLFNAAAERMFGVPACVAVGQPLSRFVTSNKGDERDASTQRVIPSATSLRSEVVGARSDGQLIPLEASISTGEIGTRRFQTWVLRDLTEQRAMEENLRSAEDRLRQKQKLEAVGSLAGGVAHEFNNLLQAILGYTKYAMKDLLPSDRRYQDLEQVIKAGDRAAALTRQLLTFSRRHELKQTKVVVNDAIRDFVKMVHPLLGENIEVKTSCAEDAGAVLVDGGEFQQVLLNLAINARDAMPGGGRLMIESQAIEMEEIDCLSHPGLSPGRHVVIAVADTGCGMSQKVKERIFEPFFTTKEVGSGTGLGLAMVHGMVSQHRGVVHVYSEVGAGTTFRLYLPAACPSGEEVETSVASRTAKGGAEVILLAEDEPLVRNLAAKVLTEAGYTVLCAANGEDALRLFLENAAAIRLAVVDVVMPKMSGIQWYHRLQQLGAKVPVVFCSGHAPDMNDVAVITEQRLPFLQKPYTSHDLLESVRDALDTAEAPAGAGWGSGALLNPLPALGESAVLV